MKNAIGTLAMTALMFVASAATGQNADGAWSVKVNSMTFNFSVGSQKVQNVNVTGAKSNMIVESGAVDAAGNIQITFKMNGHCGGKRGTLTLQAGKNRASWKGRCKTSSFSGSGRILKSPSS